MQRWTPPPHPLVQGPLLHEVQQGVVHQGQVLLGGRHYGDDDVVAYGLLGVVGSDLQELWGEEEEEEDVFSSVFDILSG